jgi:hypothetical protein
MSIYQASKFLRGRVLKGALALALFISVTPISFLSLRSAAATEEVPMDSALQIAPLVVDQVVTETPVDYTYTIDGYKWEDSDGDGEWGEEGVLSGWTISVTDGEDTYEAVTDEYGYYSFTVPAGTWTVTEESQEGWEQTGLRQDGESMYGEYGPETSCQFTFTNPPQEVTFSLFSVAHAERSSDGSCDFGNRQIPTQIIDGYKWEDVDGDGFWDEDENTLSGWTIILSNSDGRVDLTETNGDGYYSFSVPAGEWIISEEVRRGWKQTGLIRGGDLYYADDESNIIESEEKEVVTSCNFYVEVDDYNYYDAKVEKAYRPYGYTCSFGNQQEERSSGSSSGTKVGHRQAPKGEVLGASTTTNPGNDNGGASAPKCGGLFLYDYMRAGSVTYAQEVIKLQAFLTGQGFFTPTTGIFDETTTANVRLFQAKHLGDVLSPWGLEEPTGYVYKTTRWKINNIVCPGSEEMPILEGTN